MSTPCNRSFDHLSDHSITSVRRHISPPPGRSVSQVLKNLRESGDYSIQSEHDYTISENNRNPVPESYQTSHASSIAHNQSTFGRQIDMPIAKSTSLASSLNGSLPRSTDIPLVSSAMFSSITSNSEHPICDLSDHISDQLDDEIDSIVSVNEKYKEVLNLKTPVSDLDINDYNKNPSAIPTPVRNKQAGLTHTTSPPPPSSVIWSPDISAAPSMDYSHPIDDEVIMKADVNSDSDDDQTLRPGVSHNM